MQSQSDRPFNVDDLVEVKQKLQMVVTTLMLQITCMRVMQGLVREYLTRNSLTGTLKAFDCERVRAIATQCDHAGLLQLKERSACSQEAQVQLLQEVHSAKA
jgi:hypothetical protein